jgi:hypothetical protein
MKSKVRREAGHVFAVIKGKFGYRKAVYRGLKKNLCRLYMLFCGANLPRRRRSPDGGMRAPFSHRVREQGAVTGYFPVKPAVRASFHTAVFRLGGRAIKAVIKSAVP